MTTKRPLRFLEAVRDAYLYFVAEKYYNDSFEPIEGLDVFNQLVEIDKMKMPYFSGGAMTALPREYLFVGIANINEDKDTSNSRDPRTWRTRAELKIYIFKDLSPEYAMRAYSLYPIILSDIAKQFLVMFNEITEGYYGTIIPKTLSTPEAVLLNDLPDNEKKGMQDITGISVIQSIGFEMQYQGGINGIDILQNGGFLSKYSEEVRPRQQFLE